MLPSVSTLLNPPNNTSPSSSPSYSTSPVSLAGHQYSSFQRESASDFVYDQRQDPQYQHIDRRKTPSSWDPHDDQMLRHLKEDQKLGWKEIAAHFPYRTTNACQFRWRRLMSGNLKSAQPAAPLPNAGVSGTKSVVAPSMPSHSRSTGRRDWTPHEDELIRTRSDLSIQELSLLLPQRSEAEINDRRNRLWHHAQQQQQQEQQHHRQHQLHQQSIPYQQHQQLNSNYTTAPAKRPSLVGRPTNHKSAFDGLRLPLPVSQKQNTNPYLIADQQQQPVYQYYP